jgi:DNA-directed RNA polymerase subunit M/transcription elongation factor TFIIS
MGCSGGMLMAEKKRNTPKKYFNKNEAGANPRRKCPKCGKYLLKFRAETVTKGEKSMVFTFSCKCGFSEIPKEEAAKIPD